MAYWIDENYINIENILRFSEYSGYNPGRVRKFPKESDIVSIIGIRSDRIDVFILSKKINLIIFQKILYLYRLMISRD